MALDREQREMLERQHEFSAWQAADATGEKPVQGFVFKGDELPGWELVKSRRKDALDPPRLDTFWQSEDDSADTLLGVQLIERPSVAAARETLLELLGEFESAGIARRTDLPIGDVVFGHEFMLVFARGNLVIQVRNAGRRVVQVEDVARTVDAVVVRQVEGGKG